MRGALLAAVKARALSKNGGRPTSIDYNAIEFRNSRIAFAKAPLDLTAIEPFDAAFSISSFEHDGLGRYGDPLDPDGDLKAMQQVKELVKPGGLLYLAVPVGRDKVVFNENGIYGRMRLPLLLSGWQALASIGFEDEWMDRDTAFGWNPTTPQGELVHPEYPEYDPISCFGRWSSADDLELVELDRPTDGEEIPRSEVTKLDRVPSLGEKRRC